MPFKEATTGEGAEVVIRRDGAELKLVSVRLLGEVRLPRHYDDPKDETSLTSFRYELYSESSEPEAEPFFVGVGRDPTGVFAEGLEAVIRTEPQRLAMAPSPEATSYFRLLVPWAPGATLVVRSPDINRRYFPDREPLARVGTFQLVPGAAQP